MVLARGGKAENDLCVLSRFRGGRVLAVLVSRMQCSAPASSCWDTITMHQFREAAMRLTPEEIKSFDELGYVFFPNCFSEEEVALLRGEAENILASNRQEVWREKTGAPRTAFAAHTYSEPFNLMARHPRLVEPLQQLFGEGVYVHQFKINAKAAFEGDVWQWHQDYGTWARDDGMPEPRAMNISIFLDEVLPINGPLMLIPKSHKYGTLAAGHDTSTTSYPLWTLDPHTVTRLCQEAAPPGGVGIVAPTGRPGSVLMFHGNLVHASPPNITPYPRKIVYLTLCAVSNHITKFTRPEWIAHRDFTPIVPVDDDALMSYAHAQRMAAE
jgi:L-proline 4-hydroxylase